MVDIKDEVALYTDRAQNKHCKDWIYLVNIVGSIVETRTFCVQNACHIRGMMLLPFWSIQQQAVANVDLH